jgi:hypothetical protein
MPLKTPTKQRALLLVAATFAIIAVVAYFIATLRTDVVQADKAAFMEMVLALSSVRTELLEQLNSISNHQRVNLDIAKLRSKLPSTDGEKRRLYWVSPNGEILGIDFASRTLVSLTPRIGVGKSQIGCSGYPESAVPASCTLE